MPRELRCYMYLGQHQLYLNTSPTSLLVHKGNMERESSQIQRAAVMGISSENSETARIAVVTGANKGIGLETVRRLAMSGGVTVVLTARNEKRGMEAVASLLNSGLSDVLFHQLDVQSQESVSSLAQFIADQFGRLDILVNNAGVSGVMVDVDGLKALNIDPASTLSGKVASLVLPLMKITHETADECLDTNYYGCKRVTKALLPLLKLSPSGANIVNVSSIRSELKRFPNEEIRKELGDIDTLTEEKIDGIVEQFRRDLKQDEVEANGWQKMLPAYSVSKAAANAYARLVAKMNPEMRVNCVHPGHVNTDINWHTGPEPVEEGAEGPVMLALLHPGGPTGFYFDRTQPAEF